MSQLPCIRRLLASLLLGGVLVLGPRPAHALGRDTKALVAGAGYGILTGTVAGLISYPISKNVRTIFIGSSLGLYFGLGVGIYHIIYRDDPGNPLREASARGAGAADQKPETGRWANGPANAESARFNDPRIAELAVAVPIARF